MRYRDEEINKNLSYTDCIGYTYAIKHDMVFLSGDQQFEKFDNVEFVKNTTH